MKTYTVYVAVEQEFVVQAESFDKAAEEALKASIRRNSPVHDHWVTSVLLDDNRR